jgi:hypothetical protein
VGQNGGPTRLWRNVGARPGLRVRLEGPAGNPEGLGAVLRVEGPDGLGPARVIRSGSGYWSADAATVVLALPDGVRALHVRWPSGASDTVPIRIGMTELSVRYANARVTR